MSSSSVTPLLTIVLFAIILIVAFLIAWRADPKNYDSSKTRIFITILTSLGIFLTFLYFYSVFVLQERQERLMIIQETSRINAQIWDGILDDIRDSSKIIPQFCASLFPLQNQYHEVVSESKNPVEIEMYKTSLSNKIFSVWQSIVGFGDFFATEPISYLSLFLQWTSSKLLYEEWEKHKIIYSHKAVAFGDLLFKYSQNNPEHSNKAYIELAEKLLNDKEFRTLIS